MEEQCPKPAAAPTSVGATKGGPGESEKCYREVFMHASDALFVIDIDDRGRLVFDNLNPAAEDAFHMPLAALRGASLDDIAKGLNTACTAASFGAILAHFEKCLHTGMPVEFETSLDLQREDSADAPEFLVRLIPLAGDRGIERIIGLGHDITLRKRMEALLEARELEFRALAENSPDIIVRYDTEGRRLYINAAYEATFRMPTAGLLGKTHLEAAAVPSAEARRIHELILSVAASSRAAGLEIALARPDGGLQAFHIRAVPEFDDSAKVVTVLTVSRDITALKQTERDLLQSRTLLQELSIHHQDARERERKRIARDLHEELGQVLSALRMEVSALPLRFGGELPELREKSLAMLALLDGGIQELRDIVTALRPISLDAGVAVALEWLVRDFSQHTGIRGELRLPEAGAELSEDDAIAVFRIVQEALLNVARHAAARRANIRLERMDTQWRLTVEDDGSGFDPERRPRRCFGILGMRERALAMGGELDVASAPGRGTVVALSFPARRSWRFAEISS